MRNFRFGCRCQRHGQAARRHMISEDGRVIRPRDRRSSLLSPGLVMMEPSGQLTTRPGYWNGRVRPPRAETHKHTAPTCSPMREQRYVTRTPLFPEPGRCQENPLGPSDREVTRITQTPGSFSLSQSVQEVTEDFDSMLKLSELRESCKVKEPTSPFCATSSSSGWSPPLRPQLTSTILHPANTPCSGRSRKRTLSGLENWGGKGQGANTYSGLSESNSESPHRENYWACAVPRTSLPALDWQSSSWDPSRAYEALLDYAYPLRPGRGVTESDISGPDLQDSGIGLDQVDRSISSPGLCRPSSGERNQRSPDLRGVRPSRVGSLPDPVGSSSEGVNCSEDRGGRHRGPRARLCSPSSAFFLPQSGRVCSDVDEEFRALPDHLQVPQLPCTQVREATAEVTPPLTGSWECVLPSSSSLPGSEAESLGAAEAYWAERPGAERRAARGESPIRPHPSPPSANPGSPGGAEPGQFEMDAMGQRGDWERGHQSDSLMQHIQVFCSHLKILIQQLHALSERMQRLSAPPVDMDGVKSALVDYGSFQSEVSSQQPVSDRVLRTGRLLLSSINSASPSQSSASSSRRLEPSVPLILSLSSPPVLRDALLLIERHSGGLQSHAQLLPSSILSATDSVLRSSDDGVEPLRTS